MAPASRTPRGTFNADVVATLAGLETRRGNCATGEEKVDLSEHEHYTRVFLYRL